RSTRAVTGVRVDRGVVACGVVNRGRAVGPLLAEVGGAAARRGDERGGLGAAGVAEAGADAAEQAHGLGQAAELAVVGVGGGAADVEVLVDEPLDRAVALRRRERDRVEAAARG